MIKKLRIHSHPYTNRGMANKEKRGVREQHVTFKFDTIEEAKKFIEGVKKWYYAPSNNPIPNSDEIKTTPNDTPKTSTVKKPVAKKRPNRNTKKNIQR